MRRTAEQRHLVRVQRGRPWPVVTPEGVPLDFVLASPADRMGAFLIDFAIQTLAIVVLALLVAWASSFFLAPVPWLWAFVILAIFLVQNFYFVFFEARGRGTTPGKRRLGIRVMDAKGGPLQTDAVLVRNLMRNLEVYLPLSAMLAPEALWPSAPGWGRVIAIVWMLVLAGLPLFNKRRLRIGDIVGGTLVAVAPRPVLLADIGAAVTRKAAKEPPAYVFTEAQLSVYGIYELQVLEDVLRGDVRADSLEQAHAAVAQRIAKKIEWSAKIPRQDATRFLREFYAALRAHLEKKLLFGKRKADKFSED